MKKTIYIASIYGLDNKGGLERVCQYLYEILSPFYKVKIIRGTKKPFNHGNWLLQSLLISIRLFFIPNKIVIGNSWHSCFYPCNFSIHHGTMYGINLYLYKGENDIYRNRISKMEKLSGFTAKKILPVGENCKEELINYYHIPEKKIYVLNNFVNDSIYVPNKTLSESNSIKILFSGRLEERKGLNKLKELSDYIENNETNFELYIACLNSQHTELFENNKKTKLKIGLSAEKMPDFYNLGDILYFPSQYEGFSMSTLEALSCGIPVIGTKWAIGKELQNLPFTKVMDENTDITQILTEAQILYNNFKDKKSEIHEIISKNFGRKQYEEKILKLISNEMK